MLSEDNEKEMALQTKLCIFDLSFVKPKNCLGEVNCFNSASLDLWFINFKIATEY